MVHEVRVFDARVLTLDARPERFLTVEKKGIMVDSFAKWRIENVGLYYTSTNGEERAVERLRRVQQGVVDAVVLESLLQRSEVRIHHRQIVVAQLSGNDRDLLLRFEILEARGLLEGKLQLVRIEDLKDDHVVAASAERADGPDHLVRVFVEVGDDDQDALTSEHLGDA